jgi:tetratricopeptide (TPR) repeat protein
MQGKIESALTYHSAGNLQQAERLYQEILMAHPDNAAALHLLGVIHYQTGNYTLAVELITKSLHINKRNPEAYNHLGSALAQKGDLDGAILSYQEAIALNPEFAEAYFNLGNAQTAGRKIDAALTCYQKAVAIKPDFFAAYYNLANAFREKGDPDEAIAAYRKALELNPNSGDIYDAIGLLLQEKEQVDEAIQYFKKAIELNPDFPGAYGNLGKSYQERGYLDEALTYYERAIHLNSDAHVLGSLYNNMGVVYQEKGRFDEALACYQNALELDPNSAGLYKNLGTFFHDNGLFDKATDYYWKALELAPDDAETYCNLGSVAEDKGLLDEALMYYQKALQRDPALAEAHWNISLTQLLAGNFEEGWKNYEWRLLEKSARPSFFPQPLWDGTSLNAKTLVVSAEQGVGDEIMFASCLPEVIAQAGLCIIECDKRLIPLFARSFPKAQMIERIDSHDAYPESLPKADFRIALGSLPKFLRPSLSSFALPTAYLTPDSREVEMWRQRLSALGTGLKIGISWRGGSKPSVKLARSTTLAQWTKLFSVPGVHFVNLQYGDCEGELSNAKETLGITIHDWKDADPLKNLDGFAAQVAALDLVISVDNSTVHMAGAAGTLVWALLPYACDWRWMRGFEDTPWYRTVRLFRQRIPGDWEGVFAQVTSHLNEYISNGVIPVIARANSYTRTI